MNKRVYLERKPNHKVSESIDIQVEISPVPFADISKAKPSEPCADIRQRVIAARKIQEESYKGIHCNAQMTKRMINEFAQPDEKSLNLGT